MSTENTDTTQPGDAEPVLTPLQADLNHARGNAEQAVLNLAFVERMPPEHPLREELVAEFHPLVDELAAVITTWEPWVEALTHLEEQFTITIPALHAHSRGAITQRDLQDLAALPPDDDELFPAVIAQPDAPAELR